MPRFGDDLGDGAGAAGAAAGGRVRRTWGGKAFTDEELSRRFEAGTGGAEAPSSGAEPGGGSGGGDGGELMDEEAARRLIAAERRQFKERQQQEAQQRQQQQQQQRRPPSSASSSPAPRPPAASRSERDEPPPPPPPLPDSPSPGRPSRYSPPPPGSRRSRSRRSRSRSRLAMRSRSRSDVRAAKRRRARSSSSEGGRRGGGRSRSRSASGAAAAAGLRSPPLPPASSSASGARAAAARSGFGGRGDSGGAAPGADLAPGQVVRLVGLKAAAHLNGELGRLDRWDVESKRWEVRLNEGEAKAIKADNLVAANVQDIRCAARPPPPPAAAEAAPPAAESVAPRTPPQQPASSSSASGPGVAGLSAASLARPPASSSSTAGATGLSQAAQARQPAKTSRRFGTVRWYNGRRRLGSVIPDSGSGTGGDLFIPAQGAPNGSQVPPQPGGLFHGTRVSFMPMALKRGAEAMFSPANQAPAEVVCMDVRALSGQTGLTVGVATDNGAKETNDDRLAATDITELGFLAGVFDGHRGPQCAEYVAKQLPQALHSAYKARAKRQGSLVKLSHAQEASLISGALSDAFEAVDKAWLIAARKKEILDGSTGLAVLVSHGYEVPLGMPPVEKLGCAALWPKPKDPGPPDKQPGTVSHAPGGVAKLFVAWAGDCRAVLLRGRMALRLSEDHRPDRNAEQARIKAAGGMIVKDSRGIWRVGPRADNRLARELQKGKHDHAKMKVFVSTSRAFGDAELKHPDPILTATPEVRVVDLVPEDWAILMGSDGLFDRLSDQVLADAVWKYMVIQGKDAVKTAQDIVKLALRAGSKDNITAIIMRLGWAAPPSEGSAAVTADAGAPGGDNMFG